MVFNLSLSNISKYRTELMGYAMIGVLIGHIIDLGHCEKTDLTIFREAVEIEEYGDHVIIPDLGGRMEWNGTEFVLAA